ncbi:MAG: HYR domain-containing protein [Saprospiraceae bacterium]|nr:HYR domain-containing protein [Saprospiraceae bacterium]
MMKNHVLNARVRQWALPLFLSFFTFSQTLFSQQPCPPVANQRTENPTFPGCLAPGSRAFRVLLVLDESGSVSPFETQFENAVRAFANTLAGSATATGQMEMGIVEFSDTARIGLAMTDVRSSGFTTAVDNYLAAQYSPAGWTNFQRALTVAATVSRVDILFFITDGNPRLPTGIQPMNLWQPIANNIKCAGTYIFAIGLGSDISNLNLQALSGPDELNNPLGLQAGADWTRQTFSSLPASLVELANSQIDRQPPTVSCPGPILQPNDPGTCGRRVPFKPVATDNCENWTVNSSPASGAVFPVGQTTVTVTARDNVGNTATCTFRVTITDLEAPQIECPANATISCEQPKAPAQTGEPIALDNCAIASISHADVRTDGSCPSRFSLARTFTATDVHGNANTCLQTIQVTDNKPPVITCPPAVTLACDLGPNAASGLATAADNCDPAPAVSHSDRTAGGDCDWLCTVQRTWLAADHCGNTSSCVQLITRDLTPPVNDALNADLNGDGRPDTLVLGVSNNTLSLPPGTGACVVRWLPSGGSTPVGLEPGNPVVSAPLCLPGGNALDANNHLVDPLVAEALKLNILVRLDPNLGKKKLNTFTDCTFAPIILSGLARRGDSDVNELLRVTNTALGKIALQPHLNELLAALRCINNNRRVCPN